MTRISCRRALDRGPKFALLGLLLVALGVGALETDATLRAGLERYVNDSIREEHSRFYEAATSHVPSSLEVGRRLLFAVKRKRLVYGVLGHSVTVGRGNYYNQSWPSVFERRLRSLLPRDVTVEVRNAAVGGSPSFPTCFCPERGRKRRGDFAAS